MYNQLLQSLLIYLTWQEPGNNNCLAVCIADKIPDESSFESDLKIVVYTYLNRTTARHSDRSTVRQKKPPFDYAQDDFFVVPSGLEPELF